MIMAKKLKADDAPDRQHNMGEMKEIIASTAANILRLKEEKATIQAAITEQRAKVKALGIKAVDFNAALRLYELEASERDESIDNLRLCFEALGFGGQGEMFPEPEAAETAKEKRHAPRPHREAAPS